MSREKKIKPVYNIRRETYQPVAYIRRVTFIFNSTKGYHVMGQMHHKNNIFAVFKVILNAVQTD